MSRNGVFLGIAVPLLLVGLLVLSVFVEPTRGAIFGVLSLGLGFGMFGCWLESGR